MNHIYRLVWNPTQQALVAVSESATGRGKSSCGSALVGALLSSVLLVGVSAAMAATPPPNTLPTGAQVTAGAATVSTAANTLTVNQSTQRAAINWQSFSVGANGTVNFVQPNAASVTLNRVVGNEQSVIAGALNANGQVFLLNSNGVLFTGNAQVNVGGIVASTLNMSDADFMAGRSTFASTSGTGSVINFGTINAADGGYVALLGNQVSNQGVITARMGTAALAAGDRISLNFNGNSMVGVTIDQGTLNALVENKQAIRADGGLVTLTAKGLDTVLGSLVNNTGEVRAQTVANREGKIYLLGDMTSGTVSVGGTLDASAPIGSNGGNGGFVETSAAHVKVATGANITTAAAHGLTGSWLIDPQDYTIAATGGDITGAQLSTSLGTTDVTIQSASGATAGAGDIHVNDTVTWSANQLTLSAQNNININTAMMGSGTASLSLLYGQNAAAAGNLSTYNVKAAVNLPAGNNFRTRLGVDGALTNYTVITALGASGSMTATDLQGIKGNATANYVLGANIDASATSGWASERFAPLSLTGTFDGLGHSITGLSMTIGANMMLDLDFGGLFSTTGSTAAIRNAGLINTQISVSNGPNIAFGALVGSNGGSIVNSYATGTTITGQGSVVMGGLVGENVSTGSILRSYTTGATLSTSTNAVGGLVGRNYGSVTSSYATGATVSSSGLVGGLIGVNKGTVGDSYASGNSVPASSYSGGLVGVNYSGATISGSYAAGAVTSSADGVGGLVGSNGGTISNSYATGAVTNGYYAGGLVGYSDSTGSINSSYATGTVSGGTKKGALVGWKATSSVTNSFYNSESNASLTAFGDPGSVDGVGSAVGKTTAEMQDIATFSGTSPAWNVVTDASLTSVYPQLRWATTGLAAGSSVWVMGATSTPVTYTLSNITTGYTYNGSAQSLSSLWAPTDIFGSTYSTWVPGTDYTFQYGGNTVTGFTNAGTYSSIGISVLKSGFATAGAGNTTGAFTIAPKALTPSATKVYDGNTTLTGAQVTLSGLVGTETLTHTGATANSMNVGASNFIASITLADGTNGGVASNYVLPTLNAANAVVAITARPVTLTAYNSAQKFYDGTTALDSGNIGIGNVVNGDAVEFTSGNGVLASKDVSNSNPALTGVGSLVLDNSNYTVVGASLGGTAMILPLPVDIGPISGASRAYDGTTSVDSGLLQINNIVSGDTVALSGTATVADKNVGTRAITNLNGLSINNSNYTLVEVSPTGSVAITPKPLSITGSTASGKTYDGTTSATIQVGSLVGLVSSPSSESLAVTGAGSFDSAAVGSRTVAIAYTLADGANGGLATNYSLANTTHSATISAIPVVTPPFETPPVVTPPVVTPPVVTPPVVPPPVEPPPVEPPPVVTPPVVLPPLPVSLNLSNAIANAIVVPQNIVQPPIQTQSNTGGTGFTPPSGPAGGSSNGSTTTVVNNVVNVPASVGTTFGSGSNLFIVTSPSANESTQSVSLSQARSMMQDPNGGAGFSGSSPGGGSNGVRDVRVPVSLNSLAEIVNGGVKLPDGVEQLLFVVKGQ